MKRRSRLTLDANALGEDKKVPGFDTERPQLEVESETPAGNAEVQAGAWSSAPSSQRVHANENVAVPHWSSNTLVRGLVVVVMGAIGVYLLRRRIF